MARKTVIRHRDIIVSASVGALLIAGTVIVQVMCISPTQSIARVRRKAATDAARKLELKAKETREVQRERAENAKLRSRLVLFAHRIPRTYEVAGLFAEVLRSADKNDLKIIHTRPMNAETVGQGLQRFPYQIELVGGYHAIARFVATLESHSSYMEITSAQLQPHEGTALRASLHLALYGGGESWDMGTPTQQQLETALQRGPEAPAPPKPKPAPPRPKRHLNRKEREALRIAKEKARRAETAGGSGSN
jgi:Tfp pilus assembly protein PilO